MANNIETLGVKVLTDGVGESKAQLDQLAVSARTAEAATAKLERSSASLSSSTRKNSEIQREANRRLKEEAKAREANFAALRVQFAEERRLAKLRADAQSAFALNPADIRREAEQRLSAEAKLAERKFDLVRKQFAEERRLAELRANATAAFGPQLAAQERENAGLQRQAGIRERLNNLLQTQRGQRILEASTARDQARSIGTANAALSRNATLLGASAVSAGQLRQATRQLPAQFTDIAVSLQAGQSPLTVFLQQGGQIRDSFGSAGAALRAVGTQIFSLINPVTILTGVLIGLGIAYAKADSEVSKLNQALILSGNASGTTADQLAEVAARIDDVAGTQSGATAALAAVAGAGRFAASEIEGIATASEKFRIATGRAVTDTVADFRRLAEDPVTAIQELNREYGFLTAAVFDQILSLQRQGQEQEAQNVATRAYAAFLDEAADKITANQTDMATGWRVITSAVYEFGDALADVFRNDPASEIRALNRELQALQSTSLFNTANATPGLRDSRVEEIQARIAEINAGAAEAEEKARKDASARRAENIAIALAAEADAVGTAEEKRAKRIIAIRNKANTAILAAQDSGNTELVAKLEADRDRIVKAIELEGSAKAGGRVRGGTVDQGAGILQSIRQQIAIQQEELKSTERLSSAERLRITVLEKLNDAKLKTTQATREAIKAALDELAAVDSQAKAIANQEAQKAFLDAVIQTEAQLAGPLAAAELNHQLNLERIEEAARKAGVASEELNRARNAEIARYKDESAEIERRLDTGGKLLADLQFELSLIGLTNVERQKAIALRGLETDQVEKYGEAIRKTFDDIERAREAQESLDGVRNSAKDAFKSFIDGSKSASDAFGDFIDSITDRIFDLLAEQAVASLFGAQGTSGDGALAGFFGSLFGGGSAKGNAFSGGNVLAFAKGGVVDRTTPFGMSGGRFGVMGEAGPEAILPLHRGRDGKLGVKAANDDAQSRQLPQMQSNLTINVQGRVDRRTVDQLAVENSRRLRVAARNA